MKKAEKIELIEEFKSKILFVLDELYLELTDEGYKSIFEVRINGYDTISDGRKNILTVKEIDEILLFEKFIVEIPDGLYNNIPTINQCKLYRFLSNIYNFNPIYSSPLDEYIRVTNEHLNNIKALGEYFNYDVLNYGLFIFWFTKKK